MLVIFKKSPLALRLAYGVGVKAEVEEVLGVELVRDGFADDITPPVTKQTDKSDFEAETKATTKKTKRVVKTK
tara:strand:- start:1113 stop:1331 length:219 start_codon:yes stop_codon:yes gene_type:complete